MSYRADVHKTEKAINMLYIKVFCSLTDKPTDQVFEVNHTLDCHEKT